MPSGSLKGSPLTFCFSACILFQTTYLKNNMEGKDPKPEKGDPDFGPSIAFLFSPSIYQLTE